MGRKGMKGFIKSAAKRLGEDEDEAAAPGGEASQQAEPKVSAPRAAAAGGTPAKVQPKAAAASSKPAAAAVPKPVETGSSDGSGDEDGGSEAGDGPESRRHMLKRHKREMLAHKKALQRAGKKPKDEAARLTAELERRHERELAELDVAAGKAAPAAAAGAGGGAAAPVGEAAGAAAAAAADRLSKYMKGLAMEGGDDAAQPRRPSKAQKRREKHAAKDRERDARIAAEKEALGTPERLAEEAELRALLEPLGLAIKEMRADGHCMYRSVEDQLHTAAGGGGGGDSDAESGGRGVPSYQELRELAAAYLRSHRAEFAPYLVPEEDGGDEDPDAYYKRYCDDVEATAAWGGHVELQALAGALARRITVYAAGMAPQVLGEAHGPEGGLELCFLRHAFGLGEHYNSTKRLLFAPGVAKGDGEASAAEAGGKAKGPSDKE